MLNHYNNADNQLYKLINEKISTQIESEKYMSLELLNLSLTNKVYSNEFARKIAGNIKRAIS